MNQNELKDLAEESAEFLGGFWDDEIERWVLPKGIWNFIGRTLHPKDLAYLFFNGQYAPILMHLGKREMEKRGHSHTMYTHTDEVASYTAYVQPISASAGVVYSEHENEFIAFWSAVRDAMKGGEGE